MTLPLPALDNRRWADLVAEGLAIVPRHAPGWTDHNAHDPGVTLVELMAFLAEQALYRANRVTLALKFRLLALAGESARRTGPSPARFAVAFDTAGSPIELPAGLLLAPSEGSRGPMTRLLQPLTVQPVALRVVVSDDGRGNPRDLTRQLHDGGAFFAWGEDPGPADADRPPALYIGISPSPSPGQKLSIRIELDPAARAAASRDDLAAALARLSRDESALRFATASRPAQGQCDQDEGLPTLDALPRDPEAQALPSDDDPSARAVWEYYTGPERGWQPIGVYLGASKRPVAGADPTRALTLDATVVIEAPGDLGRASGLASTARGFSPGNLPFDGVFLRCRLAAGRPDLAPRIARIRLNAALVEQSVPALMALRGEPGEPTLAEFVAHDLDLGQALPGLLPIQVEPFDSDDDRRAAARRIHLREFATGGERGVVAPLVMLDPPVRQPDGTAIAQLRNAPVAEGRVWLVSIEPLNGSDAVRPTRYGLRSWSPRDNLDASGPIEAHYVVDAMTGEIRFGDGERGLRLATGSVLLAAYDATLAAQGNPLPRQSWPAAVRRRGAPSLHEAWNLALRTADPAVPAALVVGPGDPTGVDLESLDDALARLAQDSGAPAALVHAAGAGGTLDGRSRDEIVSLTAPRQAVTAADFERLAHETPGAGVRRVRALAGLDPDRPGLAAPGTITVVVVPGLPRQRPEPTANVIRRVRRFLDARRALGTRLVVTGPHYAGRTLRARVRLARGARQVETAIRASLQGWVHPLTGGAGRGYPFGTDLTRAEALARLAEVPGVAEVTALELAGDGEPVYPWTLPFWAEIAVELGGPA